MTKGTSASHYDETDQLYDTPRAASFLDTQPNTLEVWRVTKRVKLPYVKIGRNVRYRKRDLEKFLEENTVRESADAP